MHPAGGDLDEQEHIETTKEDFIDGYEVAGDDALGLGGKELLPRGSRPSGGGVDPLALEDGPHRGRSDFDAKLFELALDAPVAPGLVLLGETDDEPADLPRLFRATLSARIGPATRHEGAVPAQNGLGAHEQGGTEPSRKHAGDGGKQGAVLRLEVRPFHLAAQDM